MIDPIHFETIRSSVEALSGAFARFKATRNPQDAASSSFAFGRSVQSQEWPETLGNLKKMNEDRWKWLKIYENNTKTKNYTKINDKPLKSHERHLRSWPSEVLPLRFSLIASLETAPKA